MATEDDHLPFAKKGVNAIDLIDFDYGPRNAYWHTDQDTMDKISAHSLQVVGAVVVEVLHKLQSGSDADHPCDYHGRDDREGLLGADRHVENLASKIDRYFSMLRLPDSQVEITHLMNKDSWK